MHECQLLPYTLISKRRTYGLALAEGNAAPVTSPGLPDPRLDSEADRVAAAGGPCLLGALVAVLAVDANPVGGRGTGDGSDGKDNAGELHVGGFGRLA